MPPTVRVLVRREACSLARAILVPNPLGPSRFLLHVHLAARSLVPLHPVVTVMPCTLPGGPRDFHVFRNRYREFQGLLGHSALVPTDATTTGSITAAATNAAARGQQCLSSRREPCRGCGDRGRVCGLARVVPGCPRDLHARSVERKFKTSCRASPGT